jgi:hypothetical protein
VFDGRQDFTYHFFQACEKEESIVEAAQKYVPQVNIGISLDAACISLPLATHDARFSH